MKKPTTIRGQWDLFYSKFPVIYDRFSSYEDSENKIFKFIESKVDLANKTILDVAASYQDADLILVNTCAFTQKSENDSIALIKKI